MNRRLSGGYRLNLLVRVFFLPTTMPTTQGELFRRIESYPSSIQRVVRALSSVNLNSLKILMRDGPSAALNFVTQSYHLYSGFGMPHLWQRLPWRRDLRIPIGKAEDLFPEIDFSHSPELYFLRSSFSSAKSSGICRCGASSNSVLRKAEPR